MTDTPTRPYDEPLHPHIGTEYNQWPQYPGASMRDYFAANFRFDGDGFSVAYAEALMDEPMPVQATVKERFDWWLIAEAKYRYAFADAMLRERGK